MKPRQIRFMRRLQSADIKAERMRIKSDYHTNGQLMESH